MTGMPVIEIKSDGINVWIVLPAYADRTPRSEADLPLDRVEQERRLAKLRYPTEGNRLTSVRS